MSSNFRKKFLLDQVVKNWFPGHMFRGIQDIQRMLRHIDCIIEIHDARVPLTGRNTAFRTNVTSARPHLLVMNKKDLADETLSEHVSTHIKRYEQVNEVFYTNLKALRDNSKKIIQKAIHLVKTNDRFNRTDRPDINLLVLGIPNVGKSTFINRIRSSLIGGKKNKEVAKVGDQPGVTRSVQERIRISIDPLIYIFDTPGILQPTFRDRTEDPLKLAACGLLPSQVIGNEIIADFILYWLNKHEEFEYANIIGLENGPTDNITQVLYNIAITQNMVLQHRLPGFSQISSHPNMGVAAEFFIKQFRENKFGKFVLDKDLINV